MTLLTAAPTIRPVALIPANVEIPAELTRPVRLPVTSPVIFPVISPVTFPVTAPTSVVAVIVPDALILPADAIPTPIPDEKGSLPTWRVD